MSGTSGNVRRRAGANVNSAENDDESKAKGEELNMRNTVAVSASRLGVSRQADVQIAIFLRLIVLLVVLVIFFVVTRVTTRTAKEAENEPLPTLADLESIVASWENDFSVTSEGTGDGDEENKDGASDEFDVLGGQLPVGPIPNRLWFPDCGHTGAINGFRSAQPEKQCKQNVKNTIQGYHKAWQEERFSRQTERKVQAVRSSGGSYPEVKYLTDGECLLLIELAKQELLAPFRVESNNDYKYDICRIAALYLYGGYYFDVEVQVMDPIIAKGENENVSFITAVEASGKGFFEAFVASTAKHPILKRTLDKMAEHYEEAYVKPGTYKDLDGDDYNGRAQIDDDDPATRKMMEEAKQPGDDDDDELTKLGYINAMVAQRKADEDPSWKLGPRTLKDAFISLKPEARGKYMLLQEINLDPPEEHGHWYPEVERRRDLPQQQCCCNYIVHDPRTQTPHLYSRVTETTFC